MSLKTKTILIISGFFILFGVVYYGVQRLIIFPSFLNLERDEAIQNLERCVQTIEREIYHLDTLCHDWAAWDDSYDFISTRSAEYIKANLNPSSMTTNRVNLICILDGENNVIWRTIVDLETQESMELAIFQSDRIPSDSPIIAFPQGITELSQLSVKGVLTTEYGNLIVAARPILTSERKGPVRGTLIMGRFLTDSIIQTLVDQIHVDFQIHSLGNASISKEIQSVKAMFKPDTPFVIKHMDSGSLLIFTHFRDLSGNTAFLIQTRFPRKIVEKGYATMRYAFISILLAGIFLLILVLLLLEKTVFSPASKLTKHILAIEKSGDFSVRLNMKRDDEIGAIACEFDKLVERIEKHSHVLAGINDNQRTEIKRRIVAEEALNKVNQELKNLASLDGLTKIPNRRHFDESISMEWARMKREQIPLSLIMSDVDHFKLYNDHYGHLAGDDCLRTVANVIKSQIKRPADLCARYGGEEFAVILPNTKIEGAFFIAEAIRNSIQELNIEHAMSKVSGCVTLSLGVACIIPNSDKSIEFLIKLADEALFEAKDQGRNRTVQKV